MEEQKSVPPEEHKCDLFLNKITVGCIPKLIRELKDEHSWWDRNVDNRMVEFKQWIGDPASPSKVHVRRHVANKKYKSILDCGCGLCSEHTGYKQDNYDISYTGLDQCKKLVEMSLTEGINVLHASVEEIPLPDDSVEVAFTRHVLEHIFGYQKAITEMMRTATKEVIVVFFIPPIDTVPPSSDCLKYDVVEHIWHNSYQKMAMNQFIYGNPKTDLIAWDDLTELNESVLHIYLKQPPTDAVEHAETEE